jgi:DNA-binding CsgD family transcriptional regulator
MCEYSTEEGFIYPKGELFVDAKKQMTEHIKETHGSVFEYLVKLDKKTTGLSEHQGKLLKMFYKGISDYEIQSTLNIGSISTIRNHRYALREKEKQAKVFMTIMKIYGKSLDPKATIVKPHKTATMVDRRYDVTMEESVKIIDKFFPKGTNERLTTFYVKEKHKIVILREIIKKFEISHLYKEKEVDEILKKIYPDDYVLIRRYLIQYGFMKREIDGSAYWVNEISETVKNNKNRKEQEKMQNRRKELIQDYKVRMASEDTMSGVYQIKNLSNGKIYIGSARNVQQLNGLSFQLNMGTFMNKSLQADWNAMGEDQFAIEVLESFVEGENPSANSKKLRELDRLWKSKLEPYGDKGYHKTR